MELAVVASTGLRDFHFKAEGVEYFVVKTPLRRGIWNRLGSYRGLLPLKSQVSKYASIVNDWNPDVVHVHGSEGSFGLIKAWSFTDKPVAVSLQGLLAPCSSKAYGDLLPTQIHGTFRSTIGLGLECFRYWKGMLEGAPYEEAIIRSADMILGRTQFDHAWACAYRADVRYRHIDELMRPEFSLASNWSLEKCNRHQIFCTSGNRPLKGLHVLVEAVYRLRSVFPGIKLSVASAGFVPHAEDDYARFVLRLVRKRNLEQVITFLGVLDANELVKQLQRGNCYVTPSFIENSSNALQEAMLVGVPIVATYSGGIPTIIDSERTGLTFPTGDPALLAWQISRIFRDDNLASRLGSNARCTAMERHDPLRVEEQLLSAYRELAGMGSGGDQF
ncbi:MAG TPA: glycosyltransferase [Terracidiphilus sp.]|jgi:glycosyltransferase involved in cell wall biosynthesis|nr:glycosyltransferase [Terracidiphilus sp.]